MQRNKPATLTISDDGVVFSYNIETKQFEVASKNTYTTYRAAYRAITDIAKTMDLSWDGIHFKGSEQDA